MKTTKGWRNPTFCFKFQRNSRSREVL